MLPLGLNEVKSENRSTLKASYSDSPERKRANIDNLFDSISPIISFSPSAYWRNQGTFQFGLHEIRRQKKLFQRNKLFFLRKTGLIPSLRLSISVSEMELALFFSRKIGLIPSLRLSISVSKSLSVHRHTDRETKGLSRFNSVCKK